MSNAPTQTLRPEAVVNPNMQFHNAGRFGVMVGPKMFTPTIIPTTAFQANGGVITFQCPPPGIDTAMGRMVFIKWYVQVAITATAGASGYAIDPGVYDAPRAFPVSQCISNVKVTLNNSSVTLNTNYVINAFSRCNLNNEIVSRWLSLTPSALDEFQNYNDAYATYFPNAGAGAPVLGEVSDPLASLGQSMCKISPNRGGYPLQIVSNTQGAPGSTQTAVVKFTSMEPLWVSPFNGTSEDYSLIGLNSFQISVTLTPDLQRVWSHNGDNARASTFQSITASLYNNPEVHLNWMTPPSSVPIPPAVVYPYSQVDIYQTDFTQLIPPMTTTGQLVSNNIQLTSIPNRILIFISPQIGTKNAMTSDTFARIDQISITFDNQTGILASASSEDLFFESLGNGLQMSWAQWSQTIGSVFILDACKNLPLQNWDEAPSESINKQFQIQVTAFNINTTKTFALSMYIVVISSGLLTIEQGTTMQQTTVLTRDDIVTAVSNPNKSVMQQTGTFYGGKLGDLVRTIGRVGNQVSNFTKKHHLLSRGMAWAEGGFKPPSFSNIVKSQGYGLMTGMGGQYSGGAYAQKGALKRQAMDDGYDDDDDEPEYQ